MPDGHRLFLQSDSIARSQQLATTKLHTVHFEYSAMNKLYAQFLHFTNASNIAIITQLFDSTNPYGASYGVVSNKPVRKYRRKRAGSRVREREFLRKKGYITVIFSRQNQKFA